MNSESPHKRHCHVHAGVEPPLSIAALVNIDEDHVWSLPKKDLRNYFLALQKHLRRSDPGLLVEDAALSDKGLSTLGTNVPVGIKSPVHEKKSL
jgi:hypothetical protein